jgi:hypothetical protein
MIGGILREIDARDVGGVIVGRRRDSRAQNLKSVFCNTRIFILLDLLELITFL